MDYFVKHGLLIMVLAVLIQFQLDLSFGTSLLRLNAADLVIGLLSAWFMIGFLRGTYSFPRFIDSRLPFYVAAITVVMTYGLIIGRAEIGFWSSWALFNKYAGWFVLLAYFFAGAMLVSIAGKREFEFFKSAFLGLLCVTILLHMVPSLITTLGIYEIMPVLTGNPMSIRQLSGFAGNPNAFAFFLLIGLVFIFSTASARVSEQSLLYSGLIALMFIGLWYTASRSGWAAMLVVIVVAAALKALPYRQTLYGVVAAALVIIVPLYLTPFEVNAPEKKIESIISSGELEKDVNKPADDERIATFKNALELWREHPVFGAGLGVHIHQMTSEGKEVKVIHNTFLWVLAEFGIIGAVVLTMCFFHILIVLWQRHRSVPMSQCAPHSTRYIMMILVMVSFATMSIVHEMFYQRIFWLLAGMSLVELVRKR